MNWKYVYKEEFPTLNPTIHEGVEASVFVLAQDRHKNSFIAEFTRSMLGDKLVCEWNIVDTLHRQFRLEDCVVRWMYIPD